MNDPITDYEIVMMDGAAGDVVLCREHEYPLVDALELAQERALQLYDHDRAGRVIVYANGEKILEYAPLRRLPRWQKFTASNRRPETFSAVRRDTIFRSGAIWKRTATLACTRPKRRYIRSGLPGSPPGTAWSPIRIITHVGPCRTEYARRLLTHGGNIDD